MRSVRGFFRACRLIIGVPGLGGHWGIIGLIGLIRLIGSISHIRVMRTNRTNKNNKDDIIPLIAFNCQERLCFMLCVIIQGIILLL